MRTCLTFVVCSLCCLTPAFAQTASLTGIVTDPSGKVIPNARVETTSLTQGVKRVAATNEAGMYSLFSLQPGEYLVTVIAKGFQTATRDGLVLETAQNAQLDFSMKVGAVSESVTVLGDASIINTTDASISTVVNRTFVENLPLNGQTFQNLIFMTPGVVANPANSEGQFSANGQRTTANYVTVDGVSANTGSDTFGNTIGSSPGLTIAGGTNSLLSVDALQEFRIQTSSYAPEFGRSPGAQIQLTTRSGTNEFHGALFDHFRNDKLDAADWFVNAGGLQRPPERQNDFGGVFGGPLTLPGLYHGKGKTFFFLSYEGLRLIEPQVSTFYVPTADTRQAAAPVLQRYMNAFPAPTGPEFVNGAGQPQGWGPYALGFSNRYHFDSGSARIDQKLRDSVNVFGRVSYAPSDTASRVYSGVTDAPRANNLGLTAGVTAILQPETVDDLRFNYSSDSLADTYIQTPPGGGSAIPNSDLCPAPLSPATGLCRFGFGFNGFSSFFGAGPNVSNIQHQLNLVDSLQWNRGDHAFKFGVDYRRLWADEDHTNWYIIRFQTLASIQTATPTTDNVSRYTSGVQPLVNQLSVYAQDTWRITPSLTITYGLRWEYDPAATTINGQHGLVLTGGSANSIAPAPAGSPFYRVGAGEFTPRLGVAWRLNRSVRFATVFRTGAGYFSDGAGVSAAQSTTYQVYPLYISQNIVVPLPLSSATIALPPFPSNTQPPFPTGQTFRSYASDYRLPYTIQWNAALEQMLGPSQLLSLAYVGNGGRHLASTTWYLSPNSLFSGDTVYLFGGNATSAYDALQVKFERRLTHSLQALATYTWAHAIDEISDSTTNTFRRGNSDFDIRSAFTSALSWDLPHPSRKLVAAVAGGWSFDLLSVVRSADPVNVSYTTTTLPDGTDQVIYPDAVPGQPLYVYGPLYPGGKALNPVAFEAPAGIQGAFPRNSARGFGLTQLDSGVRRTFSVTERLRLEAKIDAFNILNHPNFFLGGRVTASAGVATETFATAMGISGQLNSLYAIGGPRSLQVSLKLKF